MFILFACFVFVCLFVSFYSKRRSISAAQIFLDVWPSLKHGLHIIGYTLRENWIFLSQYSWKHNVFLYLSITSGFCSPCAPFLRKNPEDLEDEELSYIYSCSIWTHCSLMFSELWPTVCVCADHNTLHCKVNLSDEASEVGKL